MTAMSGAWSVWSQEPGTSFLVLHMEAGTHAYGPSSAAFQVLGPPAGPRITEGEAKVLFGHKKHREQAGEEYPL